MILGIESSCDESALALFCPTRGIIWESVYSQTATHAPHGGVVPELAVREHVRKFPELLSASPKEDFTQVAVTVGPGLAGSLAMGMALAKALALEKNLPLVGVNHLRAHAFSAFMPVHAKDSKNFETEFQKRLPHLGLLVSGGNTILYEIDLQKNLKLLAKTVDDAAGEALDKAAKMLGLPYPGGPLLEKLALESVTGQDISQSAKYHFPIAFKESPELKFSFSGMKTAMRYQLQKMSADEVDREKKNLAASFQSAVVGSLLLMVKRALKRGAYKSIGLCGGVAQNGAVRNGIETLTKEFGAQFMPAERKHCGDNAAMVAFAAWIDKTGLRKVESFEPGLTIDEIA